MMSKKDKYGNAGQDDLLRYIHGEMSDEDRHALEREIQKDLFASEALEGLSSRRIEEVREDMEKLENKLNKRVSGKSSVIWIRIAASVAILLTIGTLYFTVFSDMIGRADRMAVETESDQAIREKEFTEVPGPDSGKDMPENNKLDQGDKNVSQADQPTEMEVSDSRKSEKPSGSGSESGAAISAREPARQAPDAGTDENAILAESSGETDVGPSAVLFDTLIMDEMEALADQAEAGIESDEDQEVLSLELALESPATQSRARSQDMAQPVEMEEESSVELPEIETRINAAKKQAAPTRDQSPVPLQPKPLEIILADSSASSPVDGMISFREYFERNMQIPESEIRNVVTTVSISFTVAQSGRPVNIEVVNSQDELYVRESIRLINGGPDWTPSEDKTELRIIFRR